MSNAAPLPAEAPKGIGLLPNDLTDEDWANAPVLRSLDQLVVDEFTDEEFEIFLDAVSS